MAGVLSLLILGYIIAIVLVIVGSWFPLAPGSPAAGAYESLRRITDPVLDPIRRVIPPVGGVLDLSPMIVIFVLSLLRGILAG